MEQGLLYELRLPRVLLAAVVGGLLAIAGAGYQGVFRNPLADPYLLGAAAGAGLTATVAIVFMRRRRRRGSPIPAAAFAGAVGGVFLAYALGNTAGRGGGGTATLVLAGVAVTSFLTAIQTFVQQLKVEELQRDLLLDPRRRRRRLGPALAGRAVRRRLGRASCCCTGGCSTCSRSATTRRPAWACEPRGSGSSCCWPPPWPPRRPSRSAGSSAFVGIVVPHVVRRLAGGSYRIVLPLSLIGGAAFLVLADLIARTVLAPAELPIGVVTAFVGAPFFVAVLRVTRRVET